MAVSEVHLILYPLVTLVAGILGLEGHCEALRPGTYQLMMWSLLASKGRTAWVVAECTCWNSPFVGLFSNPPSYDVEGYQEIVIAISCVVSLITDKSIRHIN